MGDSALENIVRVLAIIIGTSTVMVGFARYVALPWLKDNLVKPVEEVNTQVTVNTHVSNPATMLDTIHTIENKVQGNVERIEALSETLHNIALDAAHIGASTGVIQGMWDHHLEWSQSEVNRIWKAIDRIDKVEGEGNKHHDN